MKHYENETIKFNKSNQNANIVYKHNERKNISKKVDVAFTLPIVANINPRSIYGKEEELKTLFWKRL